MVDLSWSFTNEWIFILLPYESKSDQGSNIFGQFYQNVPHLSIPSLSLSLFDSLSHSFISSHLHNYYHRSSMITKFYWHRRQNIFLLAFISYLSSFHSHSSWFSSFLSIHHPFLLPLLRATNSLWSEAILFIFSPSSLFLLLLLHLSLSLSVFFISWPSIFCFFRLRN